MTHALAVLALLPGLLLAGPLGAGEIGASGLDAPQADPPSALTTAQVLPHDPGPAAILAALDGADIAILGEIHDNPDHHAFQAEMVAALKPRALVFEMLTPEQAAAADGLSRGDAAALAAAFGWEDSGWPDFALYAPIFAAAPEARLYGAALPRAVVRRAMSEDPAQVLAEALPGRPDAVDLGLDRPLSHGEWETRLAEQAAAHCDALPDEMVPGMVNAQRLRDAAFARSALTALDQTGGPVVVITGSGHARRDQGMPAALAVFAETVPHPPRVVSLGQLELPVSGPQPFDIWRATPATPRPDPCAAFN
ncbi:ChaN family lipoprotein [Phaeovulum vinaykumarii]|uniref:Uncharacterized iron-regulated protein n=1 Tax=Phaeovulum vinaykumarii TaxID=407234 RepID=A0A1N7L375_9RHOB|nr:ChaN family lipoprotein [Phaeovulum vinaykumarii]SIS68251.1 Uncharacterized iron-regulated protein [Phaeovulum vinaykumarii]SOC00207.1 uncharacterized iron-regulated protein [Phaeovulum vinaykumarii]